MNVALFARCAGKTCCNKRQVTQYTKQLLYLLFLDNVSAAQNT